MKRKAQIEMGESVIIIFIFFILLIFGIVFFSRIQSAKVKQEVSIDVSGRASQIAQRVMFLPEVQCTKDNAEMFTGCYDVYSISAIDKLAREGKNSEYYYNLFGYSTVTVKTIFPDEGETLLLYNKTKDTYTSITNTFRPLTLCDFVKGYVDQVSSKVSCKFGVLKIETYD